MQRSAFHAGGMITDGSLRLLCLILDQFLSWLILLGCAASGLVLRSMATWWRRTTSSMSLDAP